MTLADQELFTFLWEKAGRMGCGFESFVATKHVSEGIQSKEILLTRVCDPVCMCTSRYEVL